MKPFFCIEAGWAHHNMMKLADDTGVSFLYVSDFGSVCRAEYWINRWEFDPKDCIF